MSPVEAFHGYLSKPFQGSTTRPKRTLFLEVLISRTSDEFVRIDQIEKDVRQFLTTVPVVMLAGQAFTGETDRLPEVPGALIESITLVDHSNFDNTTLLFPLPRESENDIELAINVFHLHSGDVTLLSSTIEDDCTPGGDGRTTQERPDGRVWSLPNVAFDGLWESLEFEENLPRRLLRTIIRMEKVSSKLSNTWAINWNRLVLLYGPPGSGKSSLCRAIAQKLAIRHCMTHRSNLVEMNVHSLASRYFSESAKIVSKAFDAIEAMLQEDEYRYVIVLVDEIESLSARREATLEGREPVDGMRAVNALLTGLDRLRTFRNVVILSTTNLISALDSAFIDRVDIKQEIPVPSSRIIYEILKDGYNTLQDSGILNPFQIARCWLPGTQSEPTHDSKLPPFLSIGIHFRDQSSAPMKLKKIAEKAIGLSGRTLRRLPALSLVYSDEEEVVCLEDALVALDKAVDAELITRKRAGEF